MNFPNLREELLNLLGDADGSGIDKTPFIDRGIDLFRTWALEILDDVIQDYSKRLDEQYLGGVRQFEDKFRQRIEDATKGDVL